MRLLEKRDQSNFSDHLGASPSRQIFHSGNGGNKLGHFFMRDSSEFSILQSGNYVPQSVGSAIATTRGRPEDQQGLPAGRQHRSFNRVIKVGFDLVVALLMVVVLSPLLLAVAICVLAEGGSPLYAHTRIGQRGRPFRCLKFRTMTPDAERRLDELLASDPAAAAEWSETQKLAWDPRVTRIGWLLRKTSLDELPQLFNVLNGDMSLVGPRPITEAETERYGDAIAAYFAVKPGITGLWQVSGRSWTTYARRVQLDVWYVNNWSLWRDLSILCRTIPVVLFRRGAA